MIQVMQHVDDGRLQTLNRCIGRLSPFQLADQSINKREQTLALLLDKCYRIRGCVG